MAQRAADPEQYRRAGPGRVPPHDLQAEESLLGAMMLEPEAIAQATSILTADDFYKPAHANIFDAIHALYASGQPADPVTVADELRRAGLLEAVGGHAALAQIMASTPVTTNAQRYARIVEEHALLRRLISVSGEISEIAYALPDDIPKALDRAESLVYEVNQKRVTDSTTAISELLSLNLDRLEELFERGDRITGVPTGYVDLDELLSGLQPSSLVIVGARPAMGKCVAWDTPIVDPRTGAVRTAADVHAAGTRGSAVSVLALDRHHRITTASPSAFVDDGHKAVYRVRTRLGREVRTTLSHPFLTPAGWQPLAALRPGDLVAVPAQLPVFGHDALPEGDVVALGYGCGSPDGGRRSPALRPGRALAGLIAAELGEVGPRPAALVDACLRHEVAGPPHLRRVPEAVFRLPRPQLARFLNRLLVSGATVRLLESPGEPAGVVFTTASAGMARDVQHLLLRFGVSAALASDAAGWRLEITQALDLERLRTRVGIRGRTDALTAVASRAARARSTVLVGASPTGGDGGPPAVAPGTGEQVEPGELDDLRWDPIVAIEHVGDEQVYDLTVPDLHNFVAADVFVHNTSFALGMASHAAIHANQPVLIFSLEMGSLELSQRLLCAEARIDSTRVRNGKLTQDDWSRISQAMGRLSTAPIWIDDNPNTNIMEIRAKARRIRSQVGGLGMIVVDYLQLMTGRTAAENRQVEVAEISRGLKILARELETPVVALSQLSRNLEMRADKRPMLADLRESGCLTAETRVLRADTGTEVTLGELLVTGARDVPVWSAGADGSVVAATMTHAFPNGRKPAFRLTVASGRSVVATANHPFLTRDGWARLDELRAGTPIAIAGHVPAPQRLASMARPEIAMLAHLLATGAVSPVGSLDYTSDDPDCLAAVEEAAEHFGITPQRRRDGSRVRVELVQRGHGNRENPLRSWLDDLGTGVGCPGDVAVPSAVFALGDVDLAIFLRHAWLAAGACVTDGPRPALLTAPSRRFADDVALLLSRFGVLATVRDAGHRATVECDGRALLVVFAAAAEHGAHSSRSVDTSGWGAGTASGAGPRPHGAVATLPRLDPPATTVSRETPAMVHFDAVVSIEPVGERAVYDATVLGTHNFVSNGIVTHNSLEQDSDVVMFIYRDDVYHADSSDRGQAEIIVAKHRNGPTGIVRLAFLEHYTRFANMSRAV